MTLRLQVDPGGEKYFSFAKQKLEEMKRFMRQSGLKVQSKHYVISASESIWIKSLHVGFDVWLDWIRITAGFNTPLFIFSGGVTGHAYETRDFFNRVIGSLPSEFLPIPGTPADTVIATQNRIGLPYYDGGDTCTLYIYDKTFNRTVDAETGEVSYPPSAIISTPSDELVLNPTDFVFRAGKDFFVAQTTDNVVGNWILRTYTESGDVLAEHEFGAAPPASNNELIPVRDHILVTQLADGVTQDLWTKNLTVAQSPAPATLRTATTPGTNYTSNTWIPTVEDTLPQPLALVRDDADAAAVPPYAAGDVVTESPFTISLRGNIIVATKRVVFNLNSSEGGTLGVGLRDIVTNASIGNLVGSPIGPNCLLPNETSNSIFGGVPPAPAPDCGGWTVETAVAAFLAGTITLAELAAILTCLAG